MLDTSNLDWQDIEDLLGSFEAFRGHRRDQLMRLLGIVREHDKATYEHCLRVGYIACRVAAEIGLDAKPLLYAGILHDFGKVLIPKEILQRGAGEFTEDDYEQIKEHALYGYSMLRSWYPFSAEIILRHHRFQLDSYPESLPEINGRYRGKEHSLIEECAELLALVDFYDAATTRLDRSDKDTHCVCEKIEEEYPGLKDLIGNIFTIGFFQHDLCTS